MKKTGIITIAIVAIALILFFAFAPYVTSPAGHTGVVVTMGKVSENVLPDGLHFKWPWQSVILIDNRAQKKSLSLQAFSSDIQQVQVQCSINFSVDRETSQNLYRHVGVSYYNTVMEPRVLENVKAVFARYTAENLVSNRGSLAGQVKDLLAPELKAYGIELLSVAIEDIDFTDAFTDAVEAKQVAEQTKLKSEIEQAELLLIEQNTAQRAVITANANAEVARIQADADAYAVTAKAKAEAEANTMLSQSVTPELISYREIMNWDGQLPKVYGGGEGNFVPVLNIE